MKFNAELYTNYKLPEGSPYEDKFILPNDRELIVTFQLNRKRPIYHWFKYKQGFSKDLVTHILEQIKVPKESIIYDPFLGSGTTVLAANELGYRTAGNDILPLLVFVARTKLAATRVSGEEIKYGYKLYIDTLKKNGKNLGQLWPNIKLIEKTVPVQTQKDISHRKNLIQSLNLKNEVKDILQLALINTIERCSFVKKDGGFARVVPDKKVENVDEAFDQEIQRFISEKHECDNVVDNVSDFPNLFTGDARSVELPDNNIDVTITSPPYLNKTDYTRVYSLELAFDFVKDFDDLKDLRYRSFSSHVEAKRQFPPVELPRNVESKLIELQNSNLNNAKNPDMARGYYEDLYYSLKENYRITKHGGWSCWVVWNSRLSGIEFEVDTDLANIAKSIGFQVVSIECVRLTGSSSQQVKKYGEVALRESIIYLRKL